MTRLVLRMAALAALLLIAVSALGALPSSARTVPEVTIKSISYAGSGCGRDGAIYDLSTGMFTLRGMSTTIKEGSADKRKEKVCLLSFELSYPDGWSFRVREWSGRAFVDIASGAKVVIKSQYFFSGLRGISSVESVHHGPLRSTLPFNNTFPEGLWSVCHTTKDVNTQTTVRLEGRKAKISDVRVRFDLDWRSC